MYGPKIAIYMDMAIPQKNPVWSTPARRNVSRLGETQNFVSTWRNVSRVKLKIVYRPGEMSLGWVKLKKFSRLGEMSLG